MMYIRKDRGQSPVLSQRTQRRTEDDNGKLSHTKRQSADTGHHWGVCGLFILCKKNAPWGLNPHLHALVAELHYHDGAALQAGADGCCAVGSS